MSKENLVTHHAHIDHGRRRGSIRTFCFVIRVDVPISYETFEEDALSWGCRDADILIEGEIASLSFSRRSIEFSDAVCSALRNLASVRIISVHGSIHTVPTERR